MSKPGCDIYKVARQCGVILRDAQDHSPTSRRQRECYCKPTVRAIGQRYGEERLRLVFRLLTGTPANSSALYSDVLKAVAILLARHPDLESRNGLTESFDAVDFGALRRWARSIRAPVASAGVIYTELARRLCVPVQRDLFEEAA